MTYLIEREIPTRFVGLAKILKLINGTYSILRFEDRLKAQKAVFLYQLASKVDLGYFFKLDDFGPYSDELADDYREAFSIPDKELDKRSENYQLWDDRNTAVQQVRDIMKPDDALELAHRNGEISTGDLSLENFWAEAVTSVLAIYLQLREAGLAGDKAMDLAAEKLAEYKPQLSGATQYARKRADEFRTLINI